MVFLDEDGIPKKFNTVCQYMTEFCEFRLRKYEERREKEITIMEKKIEDLTDKAKLVTLIVNGTVNVINRKKAIILEEIAEYGITEETYNKTNLNNLSKDDIDKIDEEIIKIQAELNEYRETPAYDIWRNELYELRKLVYADKTMRRTVPGRYGPPPKYQMDDDDE